MRTSQDRGWPAAVLLCVILAIPVLNHETPAVPDRAASVDGMGSTPVSGSGATRSVLAGGGLATMPPLPPSAGPPSPTRIPLRQGIAIPERSSEPTSHRTSRTVSGIASWFCGGGSPCTRGYSGGLYAAAGPLLRVGDWRGRTVLVRSGSRSVRVRLIDWCACPGRVIDLYRDAFSQLADPSRGVLKVTVSW